MDNITEEYISNFVKDVFAFKHWCMANKYDENDENYKKWKRERDIKRLLEDEQSE